jgi:short-subunit dehydrogenase
VVRRDRSIPAVEARLGPAGILVNNAGQGRVSTFADTTDEAWREELELKFFSVIRPTRAFLPQLERAGAGAIVCVNSLLARQPEPHMVATSAARRLNLVRSLASEFLRACG